MDLSGELAPFINTKLLNCTLPSQHILGHHLYTNINGADPDIVTASAVSLVLENEAPACCFVGGAWVQGWPAASSSLGLSIVWGGHVVVVLFLFSC